MKKHELQTPAILLDLDKLEHNIQSWQALCNENGKELWPMIKTHKSTALAKMQLDAGATGFLCGTLDECEMVYQLGAKHIMYAYPTANPVNIRRLLPFAKDAELIIRLDTVRAAEILNSEAEKAGVIVSYTVIVDMDFHRFGMPADAVVDFVKTLSSLKNFFSQLLRIKYFRFFVIILYLICNYSMIIFFIHLFVNIISIIFLFLLLIYNFPIPI